MKLMNMSCALALLMAIGLYADTANAPSSDTKNATAPSNEDKQQELSQFVVDLYEESKQEGIADILPSEFKNTYEAVKRGEKPSVAQLESAVKALADYVVQELEKAQPQSNK